MLTRILKSLGLMSISEHMVCMEESRCRRQRDERYHLAAQEEAQKTVDQYREDKRILEKRVRELEKDNEFLEEQLTKINKMTQNPRITGCHNIID